MTPSFNLIVEPWIPCTDQDGRPVELGLRDVLLHAHELRGLNSDSPLTTIALLRLLLAALHRVLGPENENDWLAHWSQGMWDAAALDPYFEAWFDHFDLLHHDPAQRFFQAVPEEEFGPKAIIHLVHSQGNTPTLFVHDTDVDEIGLTPAEAARALITAHSCQLGGLIGAGVSAPTSPAARGVSFVATGRNLFETLALNWFPYPNPDVFVTYPGDRPAWELENPYQADRQTVRVGKKEEVLPLGYLDYLTWQNHRIWLGAPGEDGLIREVYMGVGNPKLHDSVMNPMYHYRKTSSGLNYLRSNETRMLWRDSTALLQYRDPDNIRPPYCIRWQAQLFDVTGELVDHDGYLAAGMGNNQAKVYFYQQERLPLPSIYLADENLFTDLQLAMNKTEDVARTTRGAVSRLAELVLSTSADQQGGRSPDRGDVRNLVEHWGVMREYWGSLEPFFWEFVSALPHDPDAVLDWWMGVLKQIAEATFQRAETLAGTDARALKAAVVGRQQLNAGLKKLFKSGQEA